MTVNLTKNRHLYGVPSEYKGELFFVSAKAGEITKRKPDCVFDCL